MKKNKRIKKKHQYTLSSIDSLDDKAELVIRQRGKVYCVSINKFIETLVANKRFRFLMASKSPADHIHEIEEVQGLSGVLRSKLDG